ncbi:MAG: class I SAM-dependent methyltransferase [Alphaproteobacteria bacterium]
MTADTETLAFYDGEAVAYACYSSDKAERVWLARFAERLEPGAAVLDFGCGSGWAAHVFTGQGFRTSALDGSAGLAAEARRRYGIEVRVARFEDLDDEGRYGGIWASFCLLHDTREAMPGHLARLRRALEPGGWLYLGLKEGAGESRDRLGRRYAYFGEAEVGELLDAAGFPEVEITVEQSAGYDGINTGMMHILARRGV